MENVQIDKRIEKRLSLLEEQKSLILATIATAKTNGWVEDDSSSIGYDDREEVETEKLSAVNMVNAEDKALEQQSFSTMEFRVHHLEKSILGFDPITKKALAYEKFKEQLSLLKRVDELKKEYDTIIHGADGLKTFLESYEQVSELVSPFKDSALTMERVILTPEAKAEIIMSSAEELELVVESLKQIDGLQSIIEASEFKGLDRFLPQITPIETIHIDQSAKANEVSARITHLLDRYNGIANTLSEIFISWDHMLSTIDASISAIERKV